MISRYCGWISILLVGAISQLFVDASRADAAQKFRWQLKPGQGLQIVMSQTTTQTLTIGGQEVEIPTTLLTDMTWHVNSVDKDHVASMTQTIDRMQISLNMPNLGKIDFDSDSKEEPAGLAKTFADTLRPMIGAGIGVRMNDRGKILGVDIPKEAVAGFGGNPIAKQMMSPESLGRMMTQSSVVLPEEAIDKGHQWTITADLPTPAGKMKVDSTYTYAGAERRESRMLDKFTVDMKLGFGKAAGPLGAAVEITEQENTGAVYFDTSNGFLAESRLTQNMALNIKVGDQAIDQKIKTTITMIVTPAKAKSGTGN